LIGRGIPDDYTVSDKVPNKKRAVIAAMYFSEGITIQVRCIPVSKDDKNSFMLLFFMFYAKTLMKLNSSHKPYKKEGENNDYLDHNLWRGGCQP
jgi:hypothetical protein